MAFTMITGEKTCPKDFLENKDTPLTVGDFVTTYDKLSIKAYVLKMYNPGRASCVYGLELNDCEDDVVIHEYWVHSDSLIYLDGSFINVNGILWNIHEKVLAHDTDDIVVGM